MKFKMKKIALLVAAFLCTVSAVAFAESFISYTNTTTTTGDEYAFYRAGTGMRNILAENIASYVGGVIIEDMTTNGTTTKAPSSNAVFDALALKADLLSPSFTTPALNVATATSINKVALTAPASGATLTVADGKTLTANNSLTLQGVDASVMAIRNSSTSQDLFFGVGAGNAVTPGNNYNTGFGQNALQALTTASQSVAVGYQALHALTSGFNNVAVGDQASYTLGAGHSGTTALGSQANMHGNSDNVVAVGDYACDVASNAQDTCIGSGATVTTTKTDSIAIGYAAVVTKSNSVQLGDAAVSSMYVGPYMILGGTKFTASGCTNSATHGTGLAGDYTSGTTGACTVVVTINGATGYTAPTGFACTANDETTGNLYRQTASSTTTATFSGTTVSGDVITFSCTAY